MATFFQQIFGVAWTAFSIKIPITATMSITPWQIALGAAAIGLILKYLFNKGSEN